MTTLIGQQLGRYLIQEEIGRGGMARVYRALDRSLQRQVALKVLAPQLALDQEFLRRFEREAITAANLHHPNIVTVYDVGEANGLRYIAMAYVRGRTLHAIIRERGALGLGYAVGIVEKVAAALDYAHAQGAVHRDVKPQNILIDIEGRVLLTDFGIAQAPDGPGGERLTRTGIFMGTPEYISPEQASAQRVDGRSDLYSLGIATYEMITGVVPFSGATPQLIVAHVQSPPPPPSTVAPGQPPELDLVLARALAKRPEQRFGSGAAFVEALRIVARRNGIVPATAAQIAGLVLPRATSAPTRPEAPHSSDGLQAAYAPPAILPLPARPPAPHISHETPTRLAGEATLRGMPARPPGNSGAPPEPPAPPQRPPPRRPSDGAPTARPRRPERWQAGTRQPQLLLLGSVAGAVILALLALALAGGG
ncbi:MAG TPA: serine/threonine-protein kinase, partial [Roseiflexaceae bacterium]|nr:serine/threonine-protein kinase [Roseiflexaceae bacterium]